MIRSDIPFALYSFIVGGGVVDPLAVLGKAGAVAGAIPGVLGFVVFEGTAEVRTPANAETVQVEIKTNISIERIPKKPFSLPFMIEKTVLCLYVFCAKRTLFISRRT